MSSLVIDYSELQNIADNSSSLAARAEEYCNELGSNVYNSFGAVTDGVNDILSSAMYYVSAKQKSLTEKAEEYYAFAGKVCNLIEHAQQADKDVATKIENNQEDFLRKHSEIEAAEGIEAFLINLFVDIKNASPLFEIVADCYIAAFDMMDSAFDALKYFYECGGGKELVQMVIAAVTVVAAIATFVACFPLSLAFSWAGLVALATCIGAGIGALNAATDLFTSAQALKSRMNGDPAWASIYGKQDKFSDVLRDTNFGDGTLNKLSYGAATTIDMVEFACDAICITDSLYQNRDMFTDNLGLSLTNEGNGTKSSSFDIEEIRPQLKTEPNTAFFWSGRTEGIGGAENAANIAKSRGGVTLESTIEAKKIKMPEWDFNDASTMEAWDLASGAYAEQVSGEVRAVIGNELREGNIWENVELPRLKENKNVSKITVIDPKSGIEKVIFKR